MKETPAIIVSGASKGIGASVARWLGSRGCAVTLLARSQKELFATAEDIKRIGGRPFPLVMDISDNTACRMAVENTLTRFGRLDAIVNNAAIVEPLAKIAAAEPDAWHYHFAVNFMGPLYLIRAAILELRNRNGRIINISSGAAEIPIPTAGAYCTSKAALTHLNRVLAAEEPTVTCLAVSPGVVDTGMQAMLRKKSPDVMPPKESAYYHEIKKKNLLLPPDLPARSIAWLALAAPLEFSGLHVRFDEPRIIKASQAYFKNAL